jgi:hypothetical protein
MTRYLARFLISLAVPVTAAGLAIQANAQMLTFEFHGTLTEVVSDPYGFADEWGSVGDPFWGTLSYDPTWQNSMGAVSTNPQNHSVTYMYLSGGRYPAEQAITMSLSTPSQTRQIGDTLINASFLNVWGSPGNYGFSCEGEYAHGFGLGFNLADVTGAGLSGTSVPSSLDLNNWASHYVDIWGLPAGGYVRGDITSIQVVPEPRAEMMFALGIIVWILKRRITVHGASFQPARAGRQCGYPETGHALRP